MVTVELLKLMIERAHPSGMSALKSNQVDIEPETKSNRSVPFVMKSKPFVMSFLDNFLLTFRFWIYKENIV